MCKTIFPTQDPARHLRVPAPVFHATLLASLLLSNYLFTRYTAIT